MKKLRLLVTKDCQRNCSSCCNHGFDMDNLPIIPDDLSQYDEIMITGGEPLLFPDKLFELVADLRNRCGGKIYLYTSFGKLTTYFHELQAFDGMHVTIHEDWEIEELKSFADFQSLLRVHQYDKHQSNRLHIFPQVSGYVTIVPSLWQRITFTGWIENCPLPNGEDFMRLENLWTN